MSEHKGKNQTPNLSRRRFLFQMAGAGAGTALISQSAIGATQLLAPVDIQNPLSNYPNRDWEKTYRDLYHYDSSFTFLCAPNDTHNCLLRGFVKNGIVTRIAPTYGYHSKRPMVRKGFMDWINAGFPRDPQTGAVDKKYMQRGRDSWVAASWDEAFELAAKAMVNIARTYSGEDGQKKLLAQGYDPLMVEATLGAGTQTLKFRGGMPPLGMTRVFAQYREANAMTLLDDKIRGKGTESLGGRGFDNYSWHTDLPPGHPMVTGQQTGMNWITTKMPDSHWMTEARMKGTKVIVIAAEYSATASKADEVIVVRPGTTPALALGVAQVLISENLYDDAYTKANTDLPLLVRMDTGNTLVLPTGEKGPPIHKQPGTVLNEKQREDWGDFVFWDASDNKPVAMNRDQVSKHFSGNPQLTGEFTVKRVSGETVKCRTVFVGTGRGHTRFCATNRCQQRTDFIYRRHGAKPILQ